MRLRSIFAKIMNFNASCKALTSEKINLIASSTNTKKGFLGIINTKNSSTIPETQFRANDTENILDVPYIHQGHINTCFDACINMVLVYFGKDPICELTPPNRENISAIKDNPRGIFEGMSAKELKKFDQNGLKFFPIEFIGERHAFEDEEILNNFRQLLTSTPLIFTHQSTVFTRHVVVIKGVIGNKLIVHDPWTGGNEIRSLNWYKNKSRTGRVYGARVIF